MERSIISEIFNLVHSDIPFSDIHIEQDCVVRIKGPKGWHDATEMEPCTYEDLCPFLQILSNDWEEDLKNHKPIHRPFDTDKWRLRINVFYASGGNRIVIVIRRNPVKPMRLSDTGLPPQVRLLSEMTRGLLLVSGATGSGKTTTLGAIINEINIARSAHIVTIEDPIELVHERVKSHFSQKEIGADIPTYFKGLKEAMRQTPDVILIGEIRDAKTARTALQAAESGHLVLASIHANSAVGTIQKFLSFAVADQKDAWVEMLAATLIGIINQVLLPKLDDTGSVLASEIMLNHNQQFSGMLGQPEKLIAAFSKRDGSDASVGAMSLEDSLVRLVNAKIVSKEDAFRAIPFGQRSLYNRIKASN